MPTARISIPVRENEPRAVLRSGLAHTTTRAPSAGGGSAASSTARAQITLTETAATGSRRVRKAVPPRLVSSAIWPSTQIRPSRTDPFAGQPQHGADGDRRLRGGLQWHGSGGKRCGRTAGSDGRASARPVLDLGKAPLEHGDHVVPARVRLLIVEQRLHAGRVEPAQPGAKRGDREVVVARDRRSLGSGGGRELVCAAAGSRPRRARRRRARRRRAWRRRLGLGRRRAWPADGGGLRGGGRLGPVTVKPRLAVRGSAPGLAVAGLGSARRPFAAGGAWLGPGSRLRPSARLGPAAALRPRGAAWPRRQTSVAGGRRGPGSRPRGRAGPGRAGRRAQRRGWHARGAP